MKTFKDFLDDLIEFTVVKRAKKTAQEKQKQKREYRKIRQKKKQQMKKYRKTAGFKKLKVKSDRMAKRGLTATGKKISVAGGTGSAQRAKEKKTELKK